MIDNTKMQKGYLIIVSVILVVIVGFVGVLLGHMLLGSSKTSFNISQSNSVLYIAKSGLEHAKHDIIVNGKKCTDINGAAAYTNAPLLDGIFTITCSTNLVSTTTTAAITDPLSTNIPAPVTAGFANSGFIVIDNETIQYSGISGGIFQNVIRGVNGTKASSHASESPVTQNQCTLVSTASTVTPVGKRTVQEILPGKSFSFGGVTPVVAALSDVTLGGTSDVNNSGVTKNSFNYPGSTIITNGNVQISGSSTTNVENSSGTGLEQSSTSSALLGDVISNPNPPLFSSADDLFSRVFNQNKAYFQDPAHATQTTPINFISSPSPTGNIIWVNGTVDMQGNESATYGSLSNPAIVIIQGDLLFKGGSNLTIYGLLYVIGNVSMQGTAGLSGYGAVVSEGKIYMQGTPHFTFNTAILALLNVKNPETKTSYFGKYTLTNELFQ